jgi:hypothetical protein
MDFAFPDVCKTPILGVPVPLPYPNFAPEITAIPTQFETLILCMPAHNVATIKAISQGDDAGVEGGIISDLDMGPSTNVDFVTNVLMGGPPATKMLNMTVQNGINAVGMTIVPSQPVVMMLS